jgi:hypothetical protein
MKTDLQAKKQEVLELRVEHKTNLQAKKQEVSELKVEHKSKAKDEQKKYSKQICEKNRTISQVQKQYDEKMVGLQNMCVGLVDGIEATAKAATKADSAASKVKDVAVLCLEKYRECQVKVYELKDGLIEASKKGYQLALVNDELSRELKEMKDNYECMIRELTPCHFARDWSNHGAWPNWVIQLIIELLSHRTPPSCVSANILSVVSLICPDYSSIIKDLPGVSFVRDCRSLLVVTTKTLAAYQLAKLKLFDQLCTDGSTDWRQFEIDNVVVGFLTNNGYKTVVLDATIIPTNKTAECLNASIIWMFREAGNLLDDWRETTEEMYKDDPDVQDLLCQF